MRVASSAHDPNVLILMSMVLVWALLYFPTHGQGEAEPFPAQLESIKQKAEQAEREEAKEAAEQANISKTRFLAAASHDLRQPLHALSLYSAVLAAPEVRRSNDLEQVDVRRRDIVLARLGAVGDHE